ncbi:MAG: GNAT family protein [Anaerolineales bacterium]
MKALFKGKLIQLRAVDPETISKATAQWGRNSEYMRMLDSDPPRLYSARASKEWIKKELEKNGKDSFFFAIHALEDDRLLGHVGLDITTWNNRDAFAGIGIGEREFWGKGYGTEAMQLLLRYAFIELNLNRVTLNVFEYNQRAVRAYKKAGFRIEGRQRQAMIREGRRWDVLYMGILRNEWIDYNEKQLD